MSDVTSIDARTGAATGPVRPATTPEQLDALLDTASRATAALETLGRRGRATMLRAGAAGLEAGRDQIVETADRETALGRPRIEAELTRTCFQLEHFAEVLEEGSYLEAAVDHPGDTPMGPRPDLRRMLVPIGPVAVFGASNFPLAFSVPGGDTASALAAGNPVVAKVHSAHPATSQLVLDSLEPALRSAGAPAGVLALSYGRASGERLVQHPAIRAVGFTGSLGGGRALIRLIDQRPDPIPFYGELSGLNPVVVTPAAAAERAGDIAAGLVASVTLGGGQFCTKPGLVLVPDGADGDRLVAAMSTAVTGAPGPVMLTDGIASSYVVGLAELSGLAGARVLARGNGDPAGRTVAPTLLEVPAGGLAPRAVEECFGPVTVVVRYAGADGLYRLLGDLPPSLTATVHAGAGEDAVASESVTRLRPIAGRLVFDGYPTGVTVAWAQHHGGPWPSTNSLHSSVGASAVRRFLRPQAWQNAPAALLPPELRDGPVDVPRRVDGVLRLPG